MKNSVWYFPRVYVCDMEILRKTRYPASSDTYRIQRITMWHEVIGVEFMAVEWGDTLED